MSVQGRTAWKDLKRWLEEKEEVKGPLKDAEAHSNCPLPLLQPRQRHEKQLVEESCTREIEDEAGSSAKKKKIYSWFIHTAVSQILRRHNLLQKKEIKKQTKLSQWLACMLYEHTHKNAYFEVNTRYICTVYSVEETDFELNTRHASFKISKCRKREGKKLEIRKVHHPSSVGGGVGTSWVISITLQGRSRRRNHTSSRHATPKPPVTLKGPYQSVNCSNLNHGQRKRGGGGNKTRLWTSKALLPPSQCCQLSARSRCQKFAVKYDGYKVSFTVGKKITC